VNGLTLCGVGRGTTLDFIEVSNSGDDAFEWFGGTVNAKHLLAWNTKDDDYDFDEGYVGNLQFIIAYRGDLADNSGSAFIESDNNSAAAAFSGKNRTRATIANATFVGPDVLAVRSGVVGTFDGGIYFRRNSRINFANSVAYCGALPAAIGITPTTRNDIDALPTATADRSYIRYNLFQTTSAVPVVWDNDESNAIADGTATAAPDNVVINELGGVTQQNTAWASLAAMGINAADLTLLPTGPARTGGLSLTFLDPFFVSTTQRGAVIDADKWTIAPGSWISISNN
jgi:spore coat protein U-like protein